MIVRLSNPLRLSLRTALVLACAALAFVAFTASASADFEINSGNIVLQNGSTTALPSPPTGSWVKLPSDAAECERTTKEAEEKSEPPPKCETFFNKASTWKGSPEGEYTPIDGQGVSPSASLELGKFQSGTGSEKIFSPLSEFAGPGGAFTFFAYTVSSATIVPAIGLPEPLTFAAPTLTFEGKASATGTHVLTTPSDLESLFINYATGEYYVGTRAGSADSRFLVPLEGSITGNSIEGPATITLKWKTHIPEAGFNPWDAEFQLVGKWSE